MDNVFCFVRAAVVHNHQPLRALGRVEPAISVQRLWQCVCPVIGGNENGEHIGESRVKGCAWAEYVFGSRYLGTLDRIGDRLTPLYPQWDVYLGNLSRARCVPKRIFIVFFGIRWMQRRGFHKKGIVLAFITKVLTYGPDATPQPLAEVGRER